MEVLTLWPFCRFPKVRCGGTKETFVDTLLSHKSAGRDEKNNHDQAPRFV